MDEAARTSGSQMNDTPADSEEPRSPEEIRHDIEQTREELGDTAEALAQKADVKGQAKAKVEDAKQSAWQKVQDAKEGAQQKTQEFGSKAKEATPDSAGAGASQVASVAQENPVPMAIGAAFVAGVVIGWILSR
jgi:ElaB/YqjD/DUF883 family membrane-anchored ribosome-binding protein